MLVLVELDRKDLENLLKATYPTYNQFDNQFDNELVKKAGHEYSDAYGKTYWTKLGLLTDDELQQLYKLCKDSWL